MEDVILKKIINKLDKFLLLMFAGWLFFWVCLVFKYIGGTTGGPYPIYWYDVLCIPFVGVIIPAILSVGIFHKIIIGALTIESIQPEDAADGR